MKGLVHVPRMRQLQKAYDELLASHVDENALALYTQWCRYDPRLAEILVSWFSKHWQTINPLDLHAELSAQPWPASVGVLLNFARKAISADKQELFNSWAALITTGIPPAESELYFIGTRAIAGKEMFKDAWLSAKEYKAWGYLGRDSLHNKQKFPSTFSPSTRKEILRELLGTHQRITTRVYLEAIQHCISKRQAERDLQAFGNLRAIGKTKARFYSRK